MRHSFQVNQLYLLTLSVDQYSIRFVSDNNHSSPYSIPQNLHHVCFTRFNYETSVKMLTVKGESAHKADTRDVIQDVPGKRFEK